jgi:hypothetical protein
VRRTLCFWRVFIVALVRLLTPASSGVITKSGTAFMGSRRVYVTLAVSNGLNQTKSDQPPINVTPVDPGSNGDKSKKQLPPEDPRPKD